jgi:hypothetical protein
MPPPPDSHEKRQRAQRKARKRREKLERRVQRNAEKRFGTARTTDMLYTLRRGESEHLTDADVWLCILDIAAYRGWKPLADPRESPPDSGSYTRPKGLTIASEDAQSLAQSIGAELPEISDDEVPLTDQPFGEDYTDSLLSRRVDGQVVRAEEVQGAREILSGRPKREAERLAVFLEGGAFSVA